MPDHPYAIIAVLFLIVAGLAAVILLVSHGLPKLKRSGPVKDAIYESGVEPIGDARRRFNIRFYLIAMLFLLFDVELIFMYPWAVVFFRSVKAAGAQTTAGRATELSVAGLDPTFLFFEMVIFVAILLVGFAYAWRKRIFTVS